MSKVVFSSCKAYLQICLYRDDNNSIFVTFGADSTYSPKNEAELQLLREYAERYKGSYLIAEAEAPTELRRKYEELEAKRIQEAEERAKAEIEWQNKLKYYRALRMADEAYR